MEELDVQKITELNNPPIIGETYLVPCLFSQTEKGRAIPVMGDFHEDAEIGFFDEHVHPDFRFFNDREFGFVVKKVICDGESLHSLVYPFFIRSVRTDFLYGKCGSALEKSQKFQLMF